MPGEQDPFAMINVRCSDCANCKKAVIRPSAGPEGELILYYCLATTRPYDVIDPFVYRDCDTFQKRA